MYPIIAAAMTMPATAPCERTGPEMIAVIHPAVTKVLSRSATARRTVHHREVPGAAEPYELRSLNVPGERSPYAIG